MASQPNDEPCGIDGCLRVPPTKQGLAIHRVKGHPDTVLLVTRDHEAEAIEQAERGPIADEMNIERESGGELDRDIDDDHLLSTHVELSDEEVALVAAVKFLFAYEDTDVVCAALADYFEWAKEEPNVKNALELRRRAMKAASK